MPVNKSTDFSGQAFYIGLDVHKTSWTVTIRAVNLELSHFTQPPEVELLVQHLQSRYAGGRYFSAYEAGFCGTSLHHRLCAAGLHNIIIHAADLPESDKEKKNKTDLHDSRAIARYLEAGVLSGIHIMPAQQQERRGLFRCRQAKVRDVTRSTNRIRSFLYYRGIELPQAFRDKDYISQNFLQYLESLPLLTAEGALSLQQYTSDLRYQRAQLLELTRKLRKTVSTHYPDSYASLLTVPGFGPITTMGFLLETGDLNRFTKPDEFCAYLGLIPSEHSSGERVYDKRIQPRCNRHLRPLLIEAAWMAIRRCPVLLLYYRKHAGKTPKKAIVKVARKLALIARAVAVNKTTYQADYVPQQPAAAGV